MPRRRPPKLDKTEQVGLTESDAQLWDKVADTVTPLGRSGRQAVPLPKRTRPVIGSGSVAMAPPTPAYEPQPLDRHERKKVASGRRPIDITLDLHGLSQDRAHALLVRRVREAYHRGQRTLLVVTGKGGRRYAQDGRETPVAHRLRTHFGLEGGVLKRMLPIWLRSAEIAPYIAGFADADKAHGGSGALYVTLKRIPK